jgi:NADH dehydrogenase
VAEAIARTLQRIDAPRLTFECGGPRVYSYEELLRTIAREAGLKPILVPIPFAAWHALARVAEMLPTAPVTRNQVELMEVDTVASADLPGFAELGILPRAIEPTLQEIVQGGRAT